MSQTTQDGMMGDFSEEPVPMPLEVLVPKSHQRGLTFRDFVTDASVAYLCDELARVAGVPIWLRDQRGEVIVPTLSGSRGDSAAADRSEGKGNTGGLSADVERMGPASALPECAWTTVPESEGRARAYSLLGLADDGRHEVASIPLRIRAGLLGAIAVALPRDAAAEVTGPIRRALTLLASAVSEICEAEWWLSKRVRELDALYRLSSLLSASADAEKIIADALNLAIDVLGVDAGSIALLDDQTAEERVLIKARRGLSDGWAAQTQPLSIGGQLRKAALQGQVVAIEDLTTDERILDHQRVRDEGLASLLTTGLLDQGRPIGLIRLYSRTHRVFTAAEGDLLRAIAEHTASAITTASLRRLRMQDERLNRQVRLAASVQRRMLPRVNPKVEPFEVAAHYAPTLELGGDFYDFLDLGGHLGVLIGDVAGKGVPAALLMAGVRSSIRAFAQQLYHIDEIMEKTNAALAHDTLDNEFATVWLGVADPNTLRLTYCGAGHDWPLLVRVPRDRAVEERDVHRLTADGMALGIDPAQKYPKGMFQLQRGDVLVTFTDGLHDATSPDGRKFGGTRLKKTILELLRAEPNASAGRIVDSVLGAVRQHAGISGRHDDITLVVLKVKDHAASQQPTGPAI